MNYATVKTSIIISVGICICANYSVLEKCQDIVTQKSKTKEKSLWRIKCIDRKMSPGYKNLISETFILYHKFNEVKLCEADDVAGCS